MIILEIFAVARAVIFNYPNKHLQLSEPEDLVMLHIHGGGFISQVKLVADMISTRYICTFMCILAGKKSILIQTKKPHLVSSLHLYLYLYL